MASYFVYDFQIEPVLLCIIYSYFSSSVRDNQNRKHNSALRCEIITSDPEPLKREIIETLHHSATEIIGKGVYSGQEKTVLVCVLNPAQLTEMTRILAKYPGSFVSVGQVNAVLGNFKRLDSNSKPEKQIYDTGKTPVKK